MNKAQQRKLTQINSNPHHKRKSFKKWALKNQRTMTAPKQRIEARKKKSIRPWNVGVHN